MENERAASVMIGGERYEMLLTLRATKKIGEKFGGLEKLGEALSTGTFENTLEALAWIAALLINQTIDIYNFRNATKPKQHIDAETIELLLSPGDVEDVTNAILEALTKGSERHVRSEEEKNG